MFLSVMLIAAGMIMSSVADAAKRGSKSSAGSSKRAGATKRGSKRAAGGDAAAATAKTAVAASKNPTAGKNYVAPSAAECAIIGKYNINTCRSMPDCFDKASSVDYCGEEPDYKANYLTCMAGYCTGNSTLNFYTGIDFNKTTTASLSGEDKLKEGFACVTCTMNGNNIACSTNSKFSEAQTTCGEELEGLSSKTEMDAVKNIVTAAVDTAATNVKTSFEKDRKTACDARRSQCKGNYNVAEDKCSYTVEMKASCLFKKKYDKKTFNPGDSLRCNVDGWGRDIAWGCRKSCSSPVGSPGEGGSINFPAFESAGKYAGKCV